MNKWWRHPTNPDTVERLEEVALRLEEVTEDFRTRLETMMPEVKDRSAERSPDAGSPTRRRESA
jgi:hypothetical protein